MTRDQDLQSLLYASQARQPWDDAALTALLTRSRAANAQSGITGMLAYRAGRFVQLLEGPAPAIEAVFTRIRADDRHHSVRVLMAEPVTTRHFGDWTMGFEPLSERDDAMPAGFRDTFDDLDHIGDPTATLRAAQELTLWFRVRSAARAATP